MFGPDRRCESTAPSLSDASTATPSWTWPDDRQRCRSQPAVPRRSFPFQFPADVAIISRSQGPYPRCREREELTRVGERAFCQPQDGPNVFYRLQGRHMQRRKPVSRRRFVNSGLIGTGICILGKSPGYGSDHRTYGVDSQGQIPTGSSPIPLNNILVDYTDVHKKFGVGLVKQAISDKESWESKRQSILRRSRVMLGAAPQVSGDVVAPKVLTETHRAGYNELKVQFPSGTGDVIKGSLLIPDSATASSPHPAIIALHSTGPGATQAVGLTPGENQGYGMELAKLGYVGLAIDVISAGERVYPGYEPYYTNAFYKEYPAWSAMDKMISDHRKGLDYLCSLKMVNPDRLGCVGHSLGGYNAFFLQAFDSRIKAAVSSCGFTPMGKTDSPYQLARSDWFVHFNPICRDCIRSGMILCDMHEIMALCAPRPLFNYSAKKDAIFCHASAENESDFIGWWQAVDQALNQVSMVYEMSGASDQFVRVEGDGGHDFPPDVRERAYQWLDKMLS